MQKAVVVIPNLNGMKYLKDCLDSLRRQTDKRFSVLLIDNGSTDDSIAFTQREYPEVHIYRFSRNTGFCKAVNQGIRMARTPYVILLNNDTVCEPDFVQALIQAMDRHPHTFSCASKMVTMADPDRIDNAGDFYCALGWGFARGKGKAASAYQTPGRIFSACAGAAIYRRSVFDEIGLFDETHFAYLEDIDVGYRARIAGYQNRYVPDAVVHHVGSGTSGSTYNAFKIRYSSRNSLYLIYKNMPIGQILLNLPFLAAGFLIKWFFFVQKGYGKDYALGLWKGLQLCHKEKKVVFQKKNLWNYICIQIELWINGFRRFTECGRNPRGVNSAQR